jgi:hypothetical protein
MELSPSSEAYSRSVARILKNLKVCNDGTLIQILCSWTLSSVLLFYLKYRRDYVSKHDV